MRAKTTFSLLSVCVVCCLLSFGIWIMPIGSSRATVPEMIDYQGKLTTAGGGSANGTFQMIFSIYPDSLGSPADWTETHEQVEVKHGVFSVLLGSVNPIPDSIFDGNVKYLGIQVESDPEMRPLKLMVTTSYAFRSQETDTAEYARTAPPDDDWDIDTSGFNIYRFTGNVGIGGLPPPDAKLYVKTDSLVGTYAVYAEGGKPVKGVSTAFEGTGVSGEGGHAGVAGVGGYIGILGQGFYGGWFEGKGYFSGNVGIGTTEPDEDLEVDGNAHITGDLTVDGSINPFPLRVYDSGWFAVTAGGTYNKTHNLGTTKVLAVLYFADDGNGSNMQTMATSVGEGNESGGGQIKDITTTTCVAQAQTHHVIMGYDSNGNRYYPSSGYYRIIMLALE